MRCMWRQAICYDSTATSTRKIDENLLVIQECFVLLYKDTTASTEESSSNSLVLLEQLPAVRDLATHYALHILHRSRARRHVFHAIHSDQDIILQPDSAEAPEPFDLMDHQELRDIWILESTIQEMIDEVYPWLYCHYHAGGKVSHAAKA